MSVIKKIIFGLEKKYKIASILASVFMVGEVLMEVIIPLIMAKIIDVGIKSKDLTYVFSYGSLMILCALISLSCGVLSGKFAAIGSLGFSKNLRYKLFSKIQTFSFGNIDKFGVSSLVTRLTTDVTNAQNTYQMCIRMCIRAPLMLISTTIMTCFLNIKLATVFFICIPILASILTLIAVKAYPRFKQMLSQYDVLNQTVQENLQGIRAVKGFSQENSENERFKKIADKVRNSQFNAEKIIIFNMPIMQLAMYICIIAILWFGGNMIISETMQVGELISFIGYISKILSSLMMLSMIFVMLVISRASITRIVEVLDEEPQITFSDKKVIVLKKENLKFEKEKIPENLKQKEEEIIDKISPELNVSSGDICFSNVCFHYDNSHKQIFSDKNSTENIFETKNLKQLPVLNNVSFKISSGQMVGLLGGTGSGKSSLVQLIPRLYDVDSGVVKVGGIPVQNYDLSALRKSIGMVLQQNILFSGSIIDNLRWGNETCSLKEMRDACVCADADKFISDFPNGYETVLGQGGVNISGGQKQRLCIARAILKKPKILIMDDSTSAVDTATDARIRAALRSNLLDTTKIIIAQRINSIQDADLIIVLDKGSICGIGSHAELIANCKIYKEVFDSQNGVTEQNKGIKNGTIKKSRS